MFDDSDSPLEPGTPSRPEGEGDASLAHAQGEGDASLAHAQGEGEPSPAHAQGEGEPSPAHAQGEGEPSPAHAQGEGEPSPAHAQGEGEARRTPKAKGSQARRTPKAKGSQARRTPKAKGSQARRTPKAKGSQARRTPKAKGSQARRKRGSGRAGGTPRRTIRSIARTGTSCHTPAKAASTPRRGAPTAPSTSCAGHRRSSHVPKKTTIRTDSQATGTRSLVVASGFRRSRSGRGGARRRGLPLVSLSENRERSPDTHALLRKWGGDGTVCGAPEACSPKPNGCVSGTVRYSLNSFASSTHSPSGARSR